MQCNYLSSNSFDPAFLQEHTSNGYLGKRDDQISRQFARERFNRHVDAGMRIVGRDSVAFLCTTGNLNDWYNVTGVIYQESIASVNHALSLFLSFSQNIRFDWEKSDRRRMLILSILASIDFLHGWFSIIRVAFLDRCLLLFFFIKSQLI